MTQARGRMEEMTVHVQLIKSSQDMQKAMIQVTRAMIKINSRVDVKGMAELIREFEKQGMITDDKQSQMDDAMDSAMGDFDDDVEEDKLYQQVLDEIGMELDMPDVKNSNVLDVETQEKLKNLKK
jgi:charged multivesicular body protein 2A